MARKNDGDQAWEQSGHFPANELRRPCAFQHGVAPLLDAPQFSPQAEAGPVQIGQSALAEHQGDDLVHRANMRVERWLLQPGKHVEVLLEGALRRASL